MRLLEMLPLLDDHVLSELKHEHLGEETGDSRDEICASLERELKSPNHLRATVMNLQPPGFCILGRLLEAPGFMVPFGALKDQVIEESLMLAARVSAGDLAGGNRDRDIYRKVLVEARRSDLELDPSEIKLLGILRSSFGIRTVEHFLMEHHDDFHAFWKTDHGFLDVMRTLRGRGLGYMLDGNLCLPSDLAPTVRQILGIEGTAASRRRLYDRLSNEDLRKALETAGLRLSGLKDERLQRLLDHYIQPREVLEAVTMADLKELCRNADIVVSGTKEELVERIALHFAGDLDIRKPEPAPPPPPPEDRLLTPQAFVALFESLRSEDLSDILTGIESSRVTGSKEAKVALLRDSRFSEMSMLMHLDAKQLESILAKKKLKLAGAKRERISRLLAHSELDEVAPEAAEPTPV